MADPSPYIIAQSICSNCSSQEFRPIKDVIYDQLLDFKLSVERASEYSEIVLEDVINKLHLILQEQKEDGIISRFSINEDSSYINFRESSELKILSSLLKKNSKEFEYFCKLLAEKLSDKADVTGQANDAGVDFIGYGLKLGIDSGPTPAKAKGVIIGQSKRYKKDNVVKETDIRSFMGASILRFAELKREKHEEIGEFTPVVYAFWTTGIFANSAKSYAKKMGLWYLDGLALAQLSERCNISCKKIDEIQIPIAKEKVDFRDPLLLLDKPVAPIDPPPLP